MTPDQLRQELARASIEEGRARVEAFHAAEVHAWWARQVTDLLARIEEAERTPDEASPWRPLFDRVTAAADRGGMATVTVAEILATYGDQDVTIPTPIPGPARLFGRLIHVTP
jgi:hypothetical protein